MTKNLQKYYDFLFVRLFCAEGMTSYLNVNGIRIFDFSSFSQPFTEQIRENAQRIADENGIEIEFIRNSGLSVRMTVSGRSFLILVRPRA